MEWLDHCLSAADDVSGGCGRGGLALIMHTATVFVVLINELPDGVHVLLVCLQNVAKVQKEGGEGGEGEGEGEGGYKTEWGMEHLCTALSHSLSLWRHISNQCPPDHTPLSAHFKLVCRVTLCLTQCLQRALVSLENSCTQLLPSYLAPVIRDVVMNGVFMLAAPQLHGLLCTFLERLDPQTYQV